VVRLIHVTLAELAYRARKAHTVSLSSFSCFPAVAPSNQSFSLLFGHLHQQIPAANSADQLTKSNFTSAIPGCFFC